MLHHHLNTKKKKKKTLNDFYYICYIIKFILNDFYVDFIGLPGPIRQNRFDPL